MYFVIDINIHFVETRDSYLKFNVHARGQKAGIAFFTGEEFVIGDG